MHHDHRSARLLAATLVAATVAGSLGACTGSHADPAQQAAQQFLAAVADHDAAGAAELTTSPTTSQAGLSASITGVGPHAKGTLDAAASHPSGADSTVDFSASWQLAGTSSPWRFTGHLALHHTADGWRVRWSPADLNPQLTAGTHLLVHRVQPARAALEASDGTPLFAPTPVVNVGIVPRQVTNLTALAHTLAAIPQLQSSAAEITAAVKAAPRPTDVVPLITLRRDSYDHLRARIHNLPGTVFTTGTEILPQSAHFGEPLLGAVGPATAQIVARSRGHIAAGDLTGIGGLQQALNTTLAGTPGITVVSADASGNTVAALAKVAAPTPGTPVRLTLNRSTQAAAEKALSALPQAATLVAVQRLTGRIVADADTAAATYDYGLAGAFPPGSTFKMATWTAAFTANRSLSPSSRVSCPATYVVDGRHFVNENKFSYPPIPISAAFGYSCNTSAIKEAMSLPRTAVSTAARALGLGASWSLPVPAFSGSMPTPVSATEQAADGIGQGRVLASPLLMALIADAVTSGTPVRPALIDGAPVRKGAPLPSGIAANMTALMRATIRLPGGTGHDLARLHGVAGKTGTAEYGTGTPPRSHAWFAGVQGDIAFALFIYDGASQHVNPADVTLRFLENRPQR